jgi:inorganic pyrophosphatase
MTYTFTVEIPENSARRIHLNYAKTEFIDFGPISEKITANSGRMPTVYGFLSEYINHVEENSEHEEYVDAFFLEKEINKNTGDVMQVKVVGMFEREDGDHKVLVVSSDSSINTFDDISKELQTTLLDFHGFNKKIIKVYNKTEAEEFLNSCKIIV